MNNRKTKNDTNNNQIYHQFRNALNSNANWIAIWELLAEHESFLRILRGTIFRISRSYHLPAEWAADLEQEAMIYFARLIQRRPDLGFDPLRSRFTTWLGTLIHGCVLKAVRQFKDSLRHRLQVFPDDAIIETTGRIDQQLDLSEQLGHLDKMYRVPLSQYCDGHSISSIATEHQTSERTIYRRIEQAVELLQKKLAS